MATGLDIAAGIAGLITLTDVVINRTYKTIQACRNAGSDSQRLLREVQSLLGILTGLKSLANEAARGSLDSYIPAEEILNCQRTLTKVRDKLIKANPDEPGISAASKWKRILKWPFSSQEMDEILQEFERHKTTFDLSVSLDTLEAVLNASSEQTKLVSGIEQVQKTLSDITRVQMTEERRKTLDFFGSFDAENSYNTNTRLRKAGTGLWLTKGPEFGSWLSTRSSKLWMYGIPGAGKTVLTAAAISETLSCASPEYGVAYYHCDYKNPMSQRLDRILGCLCGQLSRQSDACFDRLSRVYRSDADQSPRHTYPSEEELISFLPQLIIHFDEVAVIVDGVDECENAGLVARVLSDLALRYDTVRLLMASRDEVDIRGHLEDFEHLSIAARSDDLKLYVSSEIQERIQKGALKIKSSALKDEILERLINGAEGMFRWVACQMNHLCELPTDAARRKALRQLPRGLFETYDRILQRVNSSSEATKVLVERVLKWLFEDANLLDEALCEAVAIDITDENFDRQAIPDMETIMSCCSSLVRRSAKPEYLDGIRPDPWSITSGNERLELAHFTVKEYLGSDRLLAAPTLSRYFCDKGLVDTYRASTSLAYLCLKDLTGSQLETLSLYENLRSAWQFYDHAASKWPVYLRECGTADDPLRLAEKLLCQQKIAFAAWKHTYAFDRYDQYVPEGDSRSRSQETWHKIKPMIVDSEPQHCAAMLRLPNLLKRLFDRGYDVNKQSTLGTPLHLALAGSAAFRNLRMAMESRRGGENIIILDSNADPATIEILTQSGADVNGNIYWNVLCQGQEDRLCTPICIAFQEESFELAKTLLAAGARVTHHTIKMQLQQLQRRRHYNAKDLAGRLIPLLNAQEIAPGDRELLSLLQAYDPSTSPMSGLQGLENDSDRPPLAPGDVTDTLMWTCESDHLDMFNNVFASYMNKMLDDERDAEPLRRKLLSCAVDHVSLRVLERLLEIGVDINSLDDDGDAPLHVAARVGPRADSISVFSFPIQKEEPKLDIERLFRMLVAKGADPKLRNGSGNTPLHLVAKSGYAGRPTDLASCLSREEMGSLLRQADTAGLLPLHLAASNGSLAVFEELRDLDLAASLPTSDGRTLIHYAVRGRQSAALVRMLLESGIDAAAQAHDGSTAAHDCIRALEVTHRMTSTTELAQSDLKRRFLDLVAYGCDIGRPRADQKTPLNLLCELIALEGYCNRPPPCTCEDLLECAEVLLGHTPAILAEDENGRTVLNVLLDSTYRTDVFTKEAYQYTNNVVSQALLIRILNKFPETPVQNLRRNKQSALGVATFVNNKAFALLLIELGCDVDAQDMAHPSERSFTTPIQRLCSSGNSDLCVVDAALRRTRNLTHLDGWDQGLLHQAARIGLPHGSALIHLLVDAGVPVNMKNSNGLTPLMNAIRDGSVETVKTLLTRGADPSIRDNERWTAFTEACFHGKTEMVEIFFGAGASWDFVRLTVSDGREGSQWWVSVVGPTQLAAYSGHLTLLEKLLQWEDDGCMRLECSKGPSPLWLCSLGNHKDLAQVLIKRNSDVDYTYTAEHMSCLQIAATAGSIAVMEILIAAGCNIHAEDTTRRTALVHATLADQKEAIKLLSKHSQDHAVSAFRQQLQGVASIEAHSPQASSKQLFSEPYLLELIKNGDLAGVKQLHVRGTNVERPFSCNACTPLLIALAWDQLHIAEYLLDQDCEVNTGDRTCHVHAEQSSNCAELATISADRLHLLRRILFAIQSADQYLEQNVQLLSDLICLAAFCGNLPALQELLETRILDDVAKFEGLQGRRRSQNPVPSSYLLRGRTPPPYDWDYLPMRRPYNFSSVPLIAATEGDQPEAISVLVAAGVRINATDRSLRTALHTAVDDRNEKVAKLLLDHGSNPNLCARGRFTPAHIAARNGHLEMLDLLSSYGANLTGMVETFPTVLQEAVAAKRLDTAQALLACGHEFRESATTCSDLISLE